MHNLPFFNASVRRPLKFCRYIHQERCTTRSGICCWYESRDYDDQKCLAIMADTLQVQKASFGQNLLFSTRQRHPDFAPLFTFGHRSLVWKVRQRSSAGQSRSLWQILGSDSPGFGSWARGSLLRDLASDLNFKHHPRVQDYALLTAVSKNHSYRGHYHGPWYWKSDSGPSLGTTIDRS